MRNILLAGALGVILAISGAVGAQASTSVIVDTGTILSGTDVDGLFGTKGVDLSGQDYTATFYLDTLKGHYSYIIGYKYGYADQRYESLTNTVGSYGVTALFEVNGQSIALDGSQGGTADATQDNHLNTASLSQSAASSTASVSTFLYPIPSDNPLGFTLVSSYSVDSGGDAPFNSFLSGNDRLDFGIANQSSTLISSTPEPDGWALMTLAVGSMGAVLRRRRIASSA